MKFIHGTIFNQIHTTIRNSVLTLSGYSVSAIVLLNIGLNYQQPQANAAVPTDRTQVQKARLVIMGTTDLHGHIFPVDYFTGKEQKMGLAKIYTKVKEIRSQNKNTLLVDSGDLLQGTPLMTYYGKINTHSRNPMVKAMNIMRYDALGIGNHEYDYGLNNLNKAIREANFPFLSANTVRYKSDNPAYKPYIVKKINGIKVGIIGFTTPGVAIWSKGIVDKKLEFKDIVASAGKWLPKLKKEADIIVAIPHTGLEDEAGMGGYNKPGVPPENAGKALADAFPEIDVLLLGHTHTEISEKMENGVVISQADRYGAKLAVVSLDLEKTGNKWKVVKKRAETIDVKELPPDPELVSRLGKEHQKAIEYVNTPVGKTNSEWTAKQARIQDSPIVDLINQVQMETTGADLSSAALFSEESVIPAGNITIANIAGLYIYENTLSVINITGKQLRDYLEYSARYFNNYEAGKPVINTKMPGYNYDMVSGVDYKIDISRPVGQRIIELKYKGSDVSDTMNFSMALNNYRQSGGGGYEMLKNSPLIYNKHESIRDLIINYIQKKGTIRQEDIFKKNWEIVPDKSGNN